MVTCETAFPDRRELVAVWQGSTQARDWLNELPAMWTPVNMIKSRQEEAWVFVFAKLVASGGTVLHNDPLRRTECWSPVIACALWGAEAATHKRLSALQCKAPLGGLFVACNHYERRAGLAAVTN